MLWKVGIVAFGIVLWVSWPAIRIPRENFFRRRFGTLGTYLLLLAALVSMIQLIEALFAHVN
jgi:hypothetical protein